MPDDRSAAPAKALLGEAWDKYRRDLLAGAGPVQVQETRRGFYAGAAALFKLLTSGLTEDEDPQSEDMARMEGLHAELVAFSAAVAAGRA